MDIHFSRERERIKKNFHEKINNSILNIDFYKIKIYKSILLFLHCFINSYITIDAEIDTFKHFITPY